MARRRISNVAREPRKCRVCGITEPSMPFVLGLEEETGAYCQHHYREYMNKVRSKMQAAQRGNDEQTTQT